MTTAPNTDSDNADTTTTTTTTKALANLSLTDPSTATNALHALLSDAERLAHNANLTSLPPHPTQHGSISEPLADLLTRRQQIFTAHKQLLMGKQKERAGRDAAEAQSAWAAVEHRLGGVLETCRDEGWLGAAEMQRMKELCEPYFDWSAA